MRVRRSRGTLRRALLFSGLLVVLAAGAAMLGSVSLAMSQRDAVERDSDAFMDEQRIADQIVALTYEQQLDAYRFLQRADTLYLNGFNARGEEAYREMRGYLFHELSTDARLQVESIKEAHQQFEVAAERAFDLAQRGQSAAALLRLEGMDRRAAVLDAAVRQFLQARAQQRDAFRHEHELLAQRLQLALMVGAGALVLLAVILATVLRRRVLVPLDHLATAARLLGEGDTSARVPQQTYEEFDLMATGFNQMVDRVQASREEVVAQNHELRAALSHLRTTQEELVQHEKLSAMGQMLAGLAHELNNPLGGILGMAEHLRIELAESPHAAVREIGTELAQPLEREALRANALVRSLLSFARKPSGTLESVGLAAAVSTAVGLRAHAFALAGKTLYVNVSPELHVLVDGQKLQHALVNLINNALDAVLISGGDGLTITAAAEGTDLVRLDLDDDGCGFADVTAAFTPFYTTKAADKGTGLGLVLVQRFLKEFNGTVTVENRERAGARVTLRLRRASDTSDAIAFTPPPQTEAAVRVAHPTNVSPPTADVPRQRVLVVDDEPSIREVQRRLLVRAGYEVVVAASGSDARQILESQSVDLVISDLRMPGEMDGYDLLKWMEVERPELARHALLATGDVSGAASVAFPVPPERILNKPFEGAEFVRRVRAALDQVALEAAI
ncbi:MAG: response regulator [bacterium]